MRVLAVTVLMAAACGATARSRAPDGAACQLAAEQLTAAAKASAEGHLRRALRLAEAAMSGCPDQRARRVRAELLAELGLATAAIDAWKQVASWGDLADRERATAAIAAVRSQPSPLRRPSDAERLRAFLLYRDALDLRDQLDYDAALVALEAAYALAPDPLTIVQIGLTHGAAGAKVARRKAYERALAIAEWTEHAALAPSFPRQNGARARRERMLALALAPDGRRLLVVTSTGVVQVWDVQQLRIAHTHEHPGVTSVAFSSDGKLLASVASDGSLVIREVVTGQTLWSTTLAGAALASLAWAADGDSLALGADDGRILLYDVRAGKSASELRGHKGPVRSLAISPDGTMMLSAGVDGEVLLWDLGAVQTIGRFAGVASAPAVAFGEDRVGAYAGADKLIHVIDAADGTELRTHRGHSVAIAGDRIAVAAPSTVIVEDLRSGGHGRAVSARGVESLALSGDGAVVAGLTSHEIMVAATKSGATEVAYIGHWPFYRPASSLAFDSGSSTLVVAAGDVRLWDVTGTTTQVRTLAGPRDATAAAVSRDGTTLAVAEEDMAVSLWAMASGEPISELAARERGTVMQLAFSPDGKWLAETRWRSVRVTNLRDPTRVHKFTADAVAFSPDGNEVATATHKGVARVSLATAEVLGELPATGATTLAYAPGGRFLMICGQRGLLELWDTERTVRLRRFGGEGGSVMTVAWSFDGTVVATGGFDGTAILWDRATGRLLHKLIGHQALVRALAFTRDGRRLVTAGEDGVVRVWDTTSGKELGTLRAASEGARSGWVLAAPDGRVDGDDPSLLAWTIGAVRFPGFVAWDRELTPGLLGTLLQP